MAAFGQKDESDMLRYYRELGFYITRREQYDRAVPFFDKAYSIAPTDKRTLLGRSWLNSKVCQYAVAIDDIKKALELDSEDLVVTAQKALNLYLSCEFEDALVLNYRMVPKRKKPDNFTMGVMHCNEATENTIGLRTGHPLRDYYKIIHRMAWNKYYAGDEESTPKRRKRKRKSTKRHTEKIIRIPVVPLIKYKLKSKSSQDSIADSLHSIKEGHNVIPVCPAKYSPLQNYTTNIENYMAERYLDTMYNDKMFLKQLRGHPGVVSPNWPGTTAIMRMSRDGFKNLSYKQELLRTRKPFYFWKFQEARVEGNFKKRRLLELQNQQLSAKIGADKILLQIQTAVLHRQSRLALTLAEKLKIYCQLKPKKILPSRQDYLHEMYLLVAKAYFQLFRINSKQTEEDQVKRIHFWMGLPITKVPSNDSVIFQFKDDFVDWSKYTLLCEERLKKAQTSEEMCWLYHELARCFTELKEYQLARVYCRKCMREAVEAVNSNWMVNAMMLLAKISVAQHNKNDAKTELNDAIKYATKIDDPGLQEYIKKCLKIVEDVVFDDHIGGKVLQKREQQIIKLMRGEGLRDEVTYLFRKMSVMPADRRMSVMPGVALQDQKKPTASMLKASIMPLPKQTTEEAPRQLQGASKSSGSEGVGTRKGVAFMELIKYHID